MSSWTPDSWKNFNAKQQPPYSSSARDAVSGIEAFLSKAPPVVTFSEIDDLNACLSMASDGRAFILQGGDCAESFKEFSESYLRDYLRLFLQMNTILMYGLRMPIIRIGRIAGQYAKPRSSDFENIDGTDYPAYRGDIVNGVELNEREPDPDRIRQAYFYSAATTNYLDKLANQGFASMENIKQWNQDFLTSGCEPNPRLEEIVHRVTECLDFLQACNFGEPHGDNIRRAKLFTSHEALLLNYDASLVRRNPKNDKWYCLSAHQLWIGNRTRDYDSAHVEFCSGIENPIGLKIGPSSNLDEVLGVLQKLNPSNRKGKVIVILRMGAEHFTEEATPVINRIKQEGINVLWQCDPMHGNTVKSNNYKTRKFSDISAELSSFFDVCEKLDVFPAGMHAEITANNVTECLGGIQGISEMDLQKRYHTQCDPRLNSLQALQLAFFVSDRFTKK